MSLSAASSFLVRFAANKQLRLPNRTLVRLPFAAAALLLLSPSVGRARSDFNAKLEVELKVATPVLTNKFGFATSFPRPAAPAPPAGAGPNPTGEWNWETVNGGTATNVPDPLVAARKRIQFGNGLSLHVGGNTDAMPVNGSFGWGEGWASGRTKIRLGNFTGRPGLPAAETLKIDLQLDVLQEMLADASADPNILDWAAARVLYDVMNTTTGEVLSTTTLEGQDFENDPAIGLGPIAVNTPLIGLTLPANEFHNIELFAHVYAAGSSEGFNPVPPIFPPAGIAKTQARAAQAAPDPAMLVQSVQPTLFGDAIGHGDWLLTSVAGVPGEDPLARNGNNTVMLGQAVTSGRSPQDLEIAVEVPFDGFSQLALEEVLAAAAGFHGFFHELQIGQGIGDAFQISESPQQMSFAGEGSQSPPQERTGSFQLAGANDPMHPTQMAFEGLLEPGQQAQFLLAANLHDSADGVLDGMARFTIRQLLAGFGGDYNGDFVVDELDQDVWASHYGTDDFLADGDANGRVDGGDFLLWQRENSMGEIGTRAPLAAATTVPEPAAAGLSLLAGAVVLGRRGSRGCSPF